MASIEEGDSKPEAVRFRFVAVCICIWLVGLTIQLAFCSISESFWSPGIWGSISEGWLGVVGALLALVLFFTCLRFFSVRCNARAAPMLRLRWLVFGVAIIFVGLQVAKVLVRGQRNLVPSVSGKQIHSHADLQYFASVRGAMREKSAEPGEDDERLEFLDAALLDWTEQLLVSEEPSSAKRDALKILAQDIFPLSRGVEHAGPYLEWEKRYRDRLREELSDASAGLVTREKYLNEKLALLFARRKSLEADAELRSQSSGGDFDGVIEITREIEGVAESIGLLQEDRLRIRKLADVQADREQLRNGISGSTGGINTMHPNLRLPIRIPGGSTRAFSALIWIGVELVLAIWIAVLAISTVRSEGVVDGYRVALLNALSFFLLLLVGTDGFLFGLI